MEKLRIICLFIFRLIAFIFIFVLYTLKIIFRLIISFRDAFKGCFDKEEYQSDIENSGNKISEAWYDMVNVLK